MYCRYCGKHIEHDSQFCRYCGKKLCDIDEGKSGFSEKNTGDSLLDKLIAEPVVKNYDSNSRVKLTGNPLLDKLIIGPYIKNPNYNPNTEAGRNQPQYLVDTSTEPLKGVGYTAYGRAMDTVHRTSFGNADLGLSYEEVQEDLENGINMNPYRTNEELTKARRDSQGAFGQISFDFIVFAIIIPFVLVCFYCFLRIYKRHKQPTSKKFHQVSKEERGRVKGGKVNESKEILESKRFVSKIPLMEFADIHGKMRLIERTNNKGEVAHYCLFENPGDETIVLFPEDKDALSAEEIARDKYVLWVKKCSDGTFYLDYF